MSSRVTRSFFPKLRSLETYTPRRIRCFSACTRFNTDGVYRELTAMRTRTPFVEAFRKQQDEKGNAPSISVEKIERDLTPKPVSDSYTRIVLPLARDPWLLDSYINSSGYIRLGTIFMDLDALAGVIAYKHTGDSVMTVTAAVDKITLNHPLNEICDLVLSGQVSFATGRSSMEVSIQVAKAPLEGEKESESDVLMTCAFTMVSLDPHTKRPVNIPALETKTPKEKAMFDEGQKNYNRKKSASKLTLRKQTPNDFESDLIHALFLKQSYPTSTTTTSPISASLSSSESTSIAKAGGQPTTLKMKDTILHNVQIMQPQYRNRHNFMIFGGFLLKSTFELAFTCASAISHSRPTFIALDPSTFENPVPVGSVLYLSATVAYSDSPLLDDEKFRDPKVSPRGKSRIQIRVDSKVRDISHGSVKPTGVFNYTFEVEGDIKVIPETYGQFMMFLDARRRCLASSEEKGKEGA